MVESFAGTIFRDFTKFLVVHESSYPRKRTVQVICEILYPRNISNFWTREIFWNFENCENLIFWNIKYLFLLSKKRHLSTFSAFFHHRWERIFRFCQHREPNLKFELAEKTLKIGHSWKFILAKFFWSTIRESFYQ